MFQLNLVNRAIIMHEGQFLVTQVNDGLRPPFTMLFGGHIQLGETLMDSIKRELLEELGLVALPVKLCYIVENFWRRGKQEMHEIGYYFLCQLVEPLSGELQEALRPSPHKQIFPGLLRPEELEAERFEPEPLRPLLLRDAARGFSDGPKLVVINELPEQLATQSGVFAL